MRKPNAPLLSLVALGLAAAVGHASPQNGVDSELFRPALDGYGILTVDRAQTAHQFDWGFQLYVDYAANPLRLGICPPAGSCVTSNSMTPSLTTVMGWQAVMHFGFHLGLTGWLELVAELPVSAQGYTAVYGDYGSFGSTMLQRTGFYAASGLTNVPPPNAAPLDARLGLKARLFRGGGFGLALAAVATLPFGDESAFLGDAGFTFRPELIGDFLRGPWSVAVNLGGIIRGETLVYAPNDPPVNGVAAPARTLLDLGDELVWSVGMAYRFVHWAGVAAAVYGLVPLVQAARGPFDAGKDVTADVVVGLQLFALKDIAVSVGGGAGILSSAARHDDFRLFTGLTWTPAEGQGALVAGGRDSDGDGIPDAQDLCPNEPEDKDGFDDEDGCPELDNDGDGIPDAQDKCPNEPEDWDGFRDGDGCPDLDNDGDGIPDAQDKCPNEPETRNGVDDEDGCPDSGGKVTLTGGKIALPEHILFETRSEEVPARSVALLVRVADELKANPQIKRVRIEGHTDDVGSARQNQELSSARAQAVRKLLIDRGVEPERLQAVGYGDTRPLSKHKSAEARAKNRRVDFIIVEQ